MYNSHFLRGGYSTCESRSRVSVVTCRVRCLASNSGVMKSNVDCQEGEEEELELPSETFEVSK